MASPSTLLILFEYCTASVLDRGESAKTIALIIDNDTVQQQ